MNHNSNTNMNKTTAITTTTTIITITTDIWLVGVFVQDNSCSLPRSSSTCHLTGAFVIFALLLHLSVYCQFKHTNKDHQ